MTYHDLFFGILLRLTAIFIAFLLTIFITYGSMRWLPSPKLTLQLETADLYPAGPRFLNILFFPKGGYASIQWGFAVHTDLKHWYPIFSPGYRAIAERCKQLRKERES